jgi:threonine dehydrogenase-like Zn-dependent dehydrogenase
VPVGTGGVEWWDHVVVGEEKAMRAVVYEGPRQVSVKDVPDARIERPTDALVRITTTNICGSDLHMYEGRTDFEPGRWFGHENMGEVVEVGDGVDKLRVGDRVVMPFNVACGHWKNCERGLTNYCLTAQPEKAFAGAAYGFADMGPWAGGQAELLRVPWADFNCLRLGEDADERASDYVMLADIFPTGYHATEMAGVQPGDQTVIYGAGPVGLMAALSATIRGPPRSWSSIGTRIGSPSRNRSGRSRSTTPRSTRSRRCSSRRWGSARTTAASAWGTRRTSRAGTSIRTSP